MSSEEHSEGRYKQLRDYYEDTKLQVTVETVYVNCKGSTKDR